MAGQPVPSVGLYWIYAGDPTIAPGVAAPLDQLLIRTDVASLYYKSGAADTAWTRIGNGASSSGGVTGSGTAGLLAQWASTTSLGNGPRAKISNSIVVNSVITNAEAVIVSLLIPANTLAVGSAFQITAVSNSQTGANAQTSTYRIRIGPTTLTGTIVTTLTGQAGTNDRNGALSGIVTVRTIGAAGTIIGELAVALSDGGGYDVTNRTVTAAAVAIDTTVNNLLEITLNTNNAANTRTWQQACISQVA